MSEVPTTYVPNPNSANYLQENPNAIENMDLAQTMAMAGDKHESAAANMRQEIAGELGHAVIIGYSEVASLSAGDGTQPMHQKVDQQIGKINSENVRADKLYEGIAASYDKIQATKR